MDAFPLLNKVRLLTKNGHDSCKWQHKGSEQLKDPALGIYGESYFREMLCMERKRSERSKRPFLLMLIDFENVVGNYQKDKIVKEIARVLLESSRETDLKGWYRDDTVMGVIYPELGEPENGNGGGMLEAADSIGSKFLSNLAKVLQTEIISQIKLTFHSFPEKQNKSSLRKPDITLYPDLNGENDAGRFSIFLKRTLDIVGSLSAIVLFLPIFIIIAAAVKFTSKGPVLFKQVRVGQFGRKFTFLKFRSMYVNNDASIHKNYIEKFIKEKAAYNPGASEGPQKELYKISDDPRITRVGKFIRKTSLDELPQFFNVLTGDMSLVGPRPPIPYELECYDLWHTKRILEVKPGITGLWQVSGRSSCSFDEMVRLDLQYSRSWSILMDLRILVQTPWVVITSKGGY